MEKTAAMSENRVEDDAHGALEEEDGRSQTESPPPMPSVPVAPPPEADKEKEVDFFADLLDSYSTGGNAAEETSSASQRGTQDDVGGGNVGAEQSEDAADVINFNGHQFVIYADDEDLDDDSGQENVQAGQDGSVFDAAVGAHDGSDRGHDQDDGDVVFEADGDERGESARVDEDEAESDEHGGSSRDDEDAEEVVSEVDSDEHGGPSRNDHGVQDSDTVSEAEGDLHNRSDQSEEDGEEYDDDEFDSEADGDEQGGSDKESSQDNRDVVHEADGNEHRAPGRDNEDSQNCAEVVMKTEGDGHGGSDRSDEEYGKEVLTSESEGDQHEGFGQDDEEVVSEVDGDEHSSYDRDAEDGQNGEKVVDEPKGNEENGFDQIFDQNDGEVVSESDERDGSDRGDEGGAVFDTEGDERGESGRAYDQDDDNVVFEVEGDEHDGSDRDSKDSEEDVVSEVEAGEHSRSDQGIIGQDGEKVVDDPKGNEENGVDQIFDQNDGEVLSESDERDGSDRGDEGGAVFDTEGDERGESGRDYDQDDDNVVFEVEGDEHDESDSDSKGSEEDAVSEVEAGEHSRSDQGILGQDDEGVVLQADGAEHSKSDRDEEDGQNGEEVVDEPKGNEQDDFDRGYGQDDGDVVSEAEVGEKRDGFEQDDEDEAAFDTEGAEHDGSGRDYGQDDGSVVFEVEGDEHDGSDRGSKGSEEDAVSEVEAGEHSRSDQGILGQDDAGVVLQADSAEHSKSDRDEEDGQNGEEVVDEPKGDDQGDFNQDYGQHDGEVGENADSDTESDEHDGPGRNLGDAVFEVEDDERDVSDGDSEKVVFEAEADEHGESTRDDDENKDVAFEAEGNGHSALGLNEGSGEVSEVEDDDREAEGSTAVEYFGSGEKEASVLEESQLYGEQGLAVSHGAGKAKETQRANLVEDRVVRDEAAHKGDGDEFSAPPSEQLSSLTTRDEDAPDVALSLLDLDQANVDGPLSVESSNLVRSPFEDMLTAEHEARADRRKKSSSYTSRSPQSSSPSSLRLSRGSLTRSFKVSKESSSARTISPGSRAELGSSTMSSPTSTTSDHRDIISAVRTAVERADMKLYDAFVVMDSTCKGFLTRSELLHGLRALDLKLADSMLRELAKSVDVNGDGVVTFQEFFSAFETTRENPSKQTWSPPGPVKGSFFATLHSGQEDSPSVERTSDDKDWLVREEDVKYANELSKRVVEDIDDAEFDLVESWTQATKRKAALRRAPSREVAEKTTLRVTVHQADLASHCSSRVRCSVGEEVYHTKLVEDTSHPMWNEDLLFGAHEEGLPADGSLQIKLLCDRGVGPHEWDLPFWELLHFDATMATLNADEIAITRWFDGPQGNKLEVSLVLNMENMDEALQLAALEVGTVDPAALWLNKATIAEPLSFADSRSELPLPGEPPERHDADQDTDQDADQGKHERALHALRAQINEIQSQAEEEAKRRREAERRLADLDKAKEDLEKQRKRDAERFQYQIRERQSREDDLRTEMQMLQIKQVSESKTDERVLKLEQSIRELQADLTRCDKELWNANEAATAARSEREDWKTRVHELQAELRQTQARYRAKSFESAADSRVEDDKAGVTGKPSADKVAEVDRLVETITKLNRVISELRESERRAQAQLRASEDRVREQSADLGRLASENEVQARELSARKDEEARRALETRKVVAEKTRLERELEEAREQIDDTEARSSRMAEERKDLEGRAAKLAGRIEAMQDQLDESRARTLEVSSELAETRKLGIAQQRAAYRRPEARLVGRHAGMQARSLRESLFAVRAEVVQMKDAAFDALAQWNSYVRLVHAKRHGSRPETLRKDVLATQAGGVPRESKASTAMVPSTGTSAVFADPGPARLLRQLRLERLRRRNLHKSRMKFGEKRVRRICSAFLNPAPVGDGSPSARKYALDETSEREGKTFRVDPIAASAEIMVQSEDSRRYFGYDEVYVRDVAPSDADVLAADPRLCSQNGIRAQVAPIVDALFDGDRAVVVSSGPAAGATTNTIINAIFDVVGNLAANLKGEEKLEAAALLPRVSIACVHVQGEFVYDLLSSNETETKSPLRQFSELDYDRVSARGTGRVDLESAGLAVVEVKTRYEAALLASLGSGNHHNMRAPAPWNGRAGSNESAFLLYTIWVEMGDDVEGETGDDVIMGKIHIVEVTPSGEASFVDETMLSLVKVITALSHRETLDTNGATEASPGALLRCFSSSPLLGILRDCLDEESLGLAMRPPYRQRGQEVVDNLDRDTCLFHVLVHPSLTVHGPKPSEILAALHFAQRIRSATTSVSESPSDSSASPPTPSSLWDVDAGGSHAQALAVRSPGLQPPHNFRRVSLASLANDLERRHGSAAEISDASGADRLRRPTTGRHKAQEAHRTRHRTYEAPAEGWSQEDEAELDSAMTAYRAGNDGDFDAFAALEVEEHANLAKQFEALRGDGREVSSRRRPAATQRPATEARRRPSRKVSSAQYSDPPRQKSRRAGPLGSPGETEQARSRVFKVLMRQTEGMLHALFLSMDSRRTGMLSRSDFRRGMHKIDPTLSKRDLALFVDSMDSKRDGYIDFQEFFRVLGDAKTGNQHSLFMSNKRAEKIALRERRRIREQLSPERAGTPGWSSHHSPQRPTLAVDDLDADDLDEKASRLLRYQSPVRLDQILRR